MIEWKKKKTERIQVRQVREGGGELAPTINPNGLRAMPCWRRIISRSQKLMEHFSSSTFIHGWRNKTLSKNADMMTHSFQVHPPRRSLTMSQMFFHPRAQDLQNHNTERRETLLSQSLGVGEEYRKHIHLVVLILNGDIYTYCTCGFLSSSAFSPDCSTFPSFYLSCEPWWRAEPQFFQTNHTWWWWWWRSHPNHRPKTNLIKESAIVKRPTDRPTDTKWSSSSPLYWEK